MLANEFKHLYIPTNPEFQKRYCSSESPTKLTKIQIADVPTPPQAFQSQWFCRENPRIWISNPVNAATQGTTL